MDDREFNLNNADQGSYQNDCLKVIGDYKKALLQEMYFLQNDGGRKHRVTGGELLHSEAGQCTYSFELESELYLSDDAPISLNVKDERATGTVLVCEGFQIIVVIDKDFGPTISQAFLAVEPWKLLEALVDNLNELDFAKRIAMELIKDGPRLASDMPLSRIPQGQKAAIFKSLKDRITVIWGPPGTGKTYTMAQIVKEGLQRDQTILAVSHSNVSVDGIAKQTAKVLREDGMEEWITSGRVLRYGFVRDEVLSQDDYVVAYNFALQKCPELKMQLGHLLEKKDTLKKKGEYRSEKKEKVESELKRVRRKIREEERRLVENAAFTATTISKVTVDAVLKDRLFDIVLFDEVSMAYVPHIICAAMHASQKLILVGDFRQLPPIAQSEAKRLLCKDIFSFLGITNGLNAFAHPWLVMLNVQRRMHPKISAFSNKQIYHNLLVDHESVIHGLDKITNRNPMAGSPAVLIDLSGTYCAAMKNSDSSRFNILSAIFAFHTALKAERDGETSVGIITPYAAQTRLIRAMIQDYRATGKKTEIACSTVHQFQGSERNVIIFDAVESYPATKAGYLMSKEPDSVIRLINVAITRARGKLIVLANVSFWKNKYGDTPHIFYKLLKYLGESGQKISAKEHSLMPYIQSLLPVSNYKLFDAKGTEIEFFGSDVESAKEKLVISIPDGELDQESQGMMLRIIKNAKRNGVNICCKTKGFTELPDGWKEYAWGTDCAILPIIIIDNKTAWYGLPRSSGRFADGNSKMSIICPMTYRIRGEHTIAMIKEFSDIEYQNVDGIRSVMPEKYGNPLASQLAIPVREKNDEEDDGRRVIGLAAYVREHENCTKCGSPMSMAKSRSGKAYLECSSKKCKERAYLTPETINEYIAVNNISCPRDGGQIRARIGRAGIYISCEQRHYLKPEEI